MKDNLSIGAIAEIVNKSKSVVHRFLRSTMIMVRLNLDK